MLPVPEPRLPLGSFLTPRRLLIAAATLVGFALRSAGIGSTSGLDWDEAFSAALASLPPTEIVRYCLQAIQEHPPLFYILLHWWMGLAGDGEAALRMSAVVPSSLAIPLVGMATAAVAGTPAGAVAAWVLALAPLDVFYGRFARMYAVLTLYLAALLAASAYLGRESGSTSSQAARVAGAAVLLTVLTHYFVAFAVVVPAMLLAARRTGWRTVLVAGGAAGAFLLAWLAASPGLRDTIALRVGPRAVSPAVLADTFVASLGAIAWPFGSVVVGAVIMAIAAAVVIRRGDLSPPFRTAALSGFLVATLGVPALSLLGIPFAPRYVVIAMPAAAVLVGIAAARLPVRVLTPVAIVLGFVTFWFAVLPNYGHRWGDYPEAMAALRSQARPDDAIVLNGPAQNMWYERYRGDLPEGRILVRPEGPSPSEQFEAVVSGKPVKMEEAGPVLAQSSSDHPRLWVVESATDYFDPGEQVVGWLDSHAYPVTVQRFANALLRLYFTDGGGRAPLQNRDVNRELLDVRVLRVGLERWAVASGSEGRLLVAAEPPASGGARKVSVRLASIANGRVIWEQDRPLLPAGNGRLEMRGGVLIPSDAASGFYGLDLVIYEVRPGDAGAPTIRSSDVLRVGEVSIGS